MVVGQALPVGWEITPNKVIKSFHHGRSKANYPVGKLSRFIKEIQSHIRLRTSGDRHEVRQQYLPMFHSMLVRRLEREGKDSLDDIIEMMDEYFLTKEDWDSIIELGVGPMREETVKIPTLTKTAFTRTYVLKDPIH